MSCLQLILSLWLQTATSVWGSDSHTTLFLLAAVKPFAGLQLCGDDGRPHPRSVTDKLLLIKYHWKSNIYRQPSSVVTTQFGFIGGNKIFCFMGMRRRFLHCLCEYVFGLLSDKSGHSCKSRTIYNSHINFMPFYDTGHFSWTCCVWTVGKKQNNWTLSFWVRTQTSNFLATSPALTIQLE